MASRRLREAVPVLAGETKARRKAERKIRKLTQALGTVREMDVTVQILDEFAQRSREPWAKDEVMEGILRTKEAWHDVAAEAPARMRDAIERHWEAVPLLRTVGR